MHSGFKNTSWSTLGARPGSMSARTGRRSSLGTHAVAKVSGLGFESGGCERRLPSAMVAF
jgi:hypothetical protein